MRKGSIPHSIALPAGPIEPDYAPDGLTEADIDALLAEVDVENVPTRPRPGWLSVDSTEHRRDRHRTRQAARLLASNWVVGGVTGQGKTSMVRALLVGELGAHTDRDEVA